MDVVPEVGGTLAPGVQLQLQRVVICAGQDSLPHAGKFPLTQLSMVHSSKQNLACLNLTDGSECSRTVSSSLYKCRRLFACNRAQPCLVCPRVSYPWRHSLCLLAMLATPLVQSLWPGMLFQTLPDSTTLSNSPTCPLWLAYRAAMPSLIGSKQQNDRSLQRGKIR